MVNIVLNGDSKEVPEGLTLAGLLDWLGLDKDRVAVETNRKIAPRGEWERIVISSGDSLEVVHFVGGGQNLKSKI